MNNNLSLAQKRMQAAFQDVKYIVGRGKQAIESIYAAVDPNIHPRV